MIVTQPDLPVRSHGGMAALDIFYAEFNDINFYVEDAEQENLYLEILQNLFGQIKISRIFPLGGKPAVLDHALSEDNKGVKGFRAYVVDRDFDHPLGVQVEHPNIFYLDRFCIENHLLESAAIVELVIEAEPKKKRNDVSSKLLLDDMIPTILRALRPLFSLFFCAQSLGLDIKNCSSVPEGFCKPKRLWELRESAISDYEQKLKSTAAETGLSRDDINLHVELACSLANTLSEDELVSGKFVVAMIFHYIKRTYSFGSMTFESFVYRLAKNCKLQSMAGLARRVRVGLDAHREMVATGTAGT